jgi:hypothetical protein
VAFHAAEHGRAWQPKKSSCLAPITTGFAECIQQLHTLKFKGFLLNGIQRFGRGFHPFFFPSR